LLQNNLLNGFSVISIIIIPSSHSINAIGQICAPQEWQQEGAPHQNA
jgi:hypothetical protein